MPSVYEFRIEIQWRLKQAERIGATGYEINSGQLHREMGGYPGTNHQMPSCCEAMYAEQKDEDVVKKAPPKGKGASLTIHYQLPR